MSAELEAVRDWVTSRAKDVPPGGVTDDLPLLADRYLTSLHIPELILLLERIRRRPIDVEDLRPGDFADLRTINARFLTTDGAA